MRSPTGRERRIAWLRKLAAAIGAVGLLGSAAQAHAHVALDRLALEARVDALRKALRESASDSESRESGDNKLAQWWNNWGNWPNWGNWRNWFNR